MTDTDTTNNTDKTDKKSFAFGCVLGLLTYYIIICLILVLVSEYAFNNRIIFNKEPEILTARQALKISRKVHQTAETNKIMQHITSKVKSQANDDGTTSCEIKWEELNCTYDDWIEARDKLINIGYAITEHTEDGNSLIIIDWEN